MANNAIVNPVNKKHRKTLEAVFSTPAPKNLEWSRIESLFIALGAEVIEGRGSRVRFVLDTIVGTFHRSHPAKEAKPYQVSDARDFPTNAGVKP
uniref:HicA toxin of toxin-antitoxin n=1 Tax=Candidatus Kentrum sp. LFY TaxID=2126342 RepID=A0A450UL72_9GAMM|nr:MAG: HicA toxin of toxin-antitoxin [Candidatus Kentron sp. LFY]